MQEKDIVQSLSNLKRVVETQVDLSYFNSIVGQVFSDQKVYANIQSDVQFINQIGGQLFKDRKSTRLNSSHT